MTSSRSTTTLPRGARNGPATRPVARRSLAVPDNCGGLDGPRGIAILVTGAASQGGRRRITGGAMSKFLSLAAALSVTILPSGCATEGDNSGMQLFQQVVGIASMAVGTYTKNDNLTNQGQNLFQQSLNTTP